MEFVDEKPSMDYPSLVMSIDEHLKIERDQFKNFCSGEYESIDDILKIKCCDLHCNLKITKLLDYASGEKSYQSHIKRNHQKTILNLADGLVNIEPFVQYNPAGGIIIPSNHKIRTERVITSTVEKLSRKSDCDLVVLRTDGMSNKNTKLPMLDQRPKFIGDSFRLTIHLNTVQVADSSDGFQYKNFEYITADKKYRMTSSYILSIYIDAMLKLSHIPSHLIIIMDNARNNKSDVIIGGFAYLLHHLKNVERVTLLYPSVGHTHGPTDSHFGVISDVLKHSECVDVSDFERVVSEIPSTTSVRHNVSIYNFDNIKDHMVPWKYRTDVHQIVLLKGTGDLVFIDEIEQFQAKSTGVVQMK
ncbi:unnamed protein product [Caenorhabditis angaria]|uniref:DUF7869 domain-containing protein n=1 Tax=Caenorhabditis angaria TaxID=860376 RepID=A0A9P1J164_9PELO|nr:unnamed protein product [Caenorhabditis angaria]